MESSIMNKCLFISALRRRGKVWKRNSKVCICIYKYYLNNCYSVIYKTLYSSKSDNTTFAG